MMHYFKKLMNLTIVTLMLFGFVLMMVLSVLLIDSVVHGAHSSPPEGEWAATMTWPDGLMVTGAIINDHCPGCDYTTSEVGGWMGVFNAEYQNDTDIGALVFCSNADAIVTPGAGYTTRIGNQGALGYLLWKWSDNTDEEVSWSAPVSAGLQALSWFYTSDAFGRSTVWSLDDGTAISPGDLRDVTEPWSVENPVGFWIADEETWGTASVYNATTSDLYDEAERRKAPWTADAAAEGVSVTSASGFGVGYEYLTVTNHLGETAELLTDTNGFAAWPTAWGDQQEGDTWSVSMEAPADYVVEIRPGDGGQEMVISGVAVNIGDGYMEPWTTTTTSTTTTTTVAPPTTTTLPPPTTSTTSTTTTSTTTTVAPVTTTTTPDLPETGGGVEPYTLGFVVFLIGGSALTMAYIARKDDR